MTVVAVNVDANTSNNGYAAAATASASATSPAAAALPMLTMGRSSSDGASDPLVVSPSSPVSGKDSANSPASVGIEIEKPHVRRVLRWYDLVALGIGCTIGAGIFVVTGEVANQKTGPALMLSYLIAGIVCILAALCYAEFAAMSPAAGSAYSYAHTTLGQVMGWIIGWDLILEYAISAAAVASSWSAYFNSLIGNVIPLSISYTPFDYDSTTGETWSTGTGMDLIAFSISIIISIIIMVGMRESARFNNTMVLIKVIIVIFVILVGFAYVHEENYHPFTPYGFFSLSFFGKTVAGDQDTSGQSRGVIAGASYVFFAYIGFDSVTCNSEETLNVQRDLPIGIIGSLGVSSFLYMLVSIVLVGMVPYDQIDVNTPISSAFTQAGLGWASKIIDLGAVIGLTSVLMVTINGQPRLFMAMARDGLLPPWFAEIHPRFGTPFNSTVLTGICVAFFSAFFPQSLLVDVVNIGTLTAFAIVCISIIYLRHTQPDLARPFRCPWVPVIPLLGAALCILLILSLPSANWYRMAAWFGVGMIIYWFYGRKYGKKTSRFLDGAKSTSALSMAKTTDATSPSAEYVSGEGQQLKSKELSERKDEEEKEAEEKPVEFALDLVNVGAEDAEGLATDEEKDPKGTDTHLGAPHDIETEHSRVNVSVSKPVLFHL